MRTKLLGTIVNGFSELNDYKKKDLGFTIFNNGFDGEKYESIFSFICLNKDKENYEDITLDIFIDEIEISRVIKTLKKHLKENRKNKKDKL
jgi:hypothetical protein